MRNVKFSENHANLTAAEKKRSNVKSILKHSDLFKDTERVAEYTLSPEEIVRLRKGSRDKLHEDIQSAQSSTVTPERQACLGQIFSDDQQSISFFKMLYNSTFAALGARLLSRQKTTLSLSAQSAEPSANSTIERPPRF